MRFEHYLLFILISAAIDCFAQTCIVAVKSHDKIIVGADSKASYLIQDEKTGEIKKISTSMCKIKKYGNYHVAVAGSYSDIALLKAKSAFTNVYDLERSVKILSDSFSSEILRKVNVVKENYSSLFKEIQLKNNNIFSSVIIFGINHDTLHLSVLRFFLSTEETTIKVNSKYENGTIITAGHTNEIDDLLQLESTWKDGIVKGVKRLIEIESIAQPNSVGGPIDIIVVTLNGAFWIDKKEECDP